MKKLFILLMFTFIAVSITTAQSVKELLKRESKGVIYNKELTGSLRFHTNGFALAANYGTLKTYYKTNFFQFELVELKHPREYIDRIEFTPMRPGGAPRSFTFGKQNSFFGLHLGYGQKYYFSEKAKKRGVAVGMSYVVGASAGIVKPYYLELYRFNSNGLPIGTIPQKYSEENASLFLTRGAIAGGAGFGYGFDEMSVIPGGHAKVALHLDWGAYDEFAKAFEAGIMVDLYTKEVPIMVTEDNSPLFINFYISIELGKRW